MDSGYESFNHNALDLASVQRAIQFKRIFRHESALGTSLSYQLALEGSCLMIIPIITSLNFGTMRPLLQKKGPDGTKKINEGIRPREI